MVGDVQRFVGPAACVADEGEGQRECAEIGVGACATDQRHDLFISSTPTVGYLTGPTTTVAGYLMVRLVLMLPERVGWERESSRGDMRPAAW
jgi:hypothetical protein